MTACEHCWTEANRQALLLGGSVVDRYQALIAKPCEGPVAGLATADPLAPSTLLPPGEISADPIGPDESAEAAAVSDTPPTAAPTEPSPPYDVAETAAP